MRVTDSHVSGNGSTSNVYYYYYGHAHILARWVGVSSDRPRPIAGILQHGWTPWYPWLNAVDPVLTLQPSFFPRLVWSVADERMLRAAGIGRVEAIGAPFLYLQQMMPEPSPPPVNRLVVLAFHTSEQRAYDPGWEAHAEWLDGLREQFEEIEVCLHRLDYANPDARSIFERPGFRTFHNGDRDDPRFLWRLEERLRSAAAVTTPRVSTGLIYAAAIGRRVFVGGPMGRVTHTERGEEVVDDLDRVQRFQQERYPRLQEGIEGAAARTWGRERLGAESMQAPERLGHTLGWLGPRRAVSWALAGGAAANRMLSRVRSRTSSR